MAWARAQHKCTGKWPNDNSGLVHEAPSETWKAINLALFQGLRGLNGGAAGTSWHSWEACKERTRAAAHRLATASTH